MKSECLYHFVNVILSTFEQSPLVEGQDWGNEFMATPIVSATIKEVLFLLRLSVSRWKNPEGIITLYFYGSFPVSLATLVGPFPHFPLSFLRTEIPPHLPPLPPTPHPLILRYTSKHQVRIVIPHMQTVVILLKKTGKREARELAKEK